VAAVAELRVAREELARRASAEERLRFTRADGSVSAQFTDDGRGSPLTRGAVSSASGGSGLAGLGERVAELPGAASEASRRPGGRFQPRVSLPLEGGPR